MEYPQGGGGPPSVNLEARLFRCGGCVPDLRVGHDPIKFDQAVVANGPGLKAFGRLLDFAARGIVQACIPAVCMHEDVGV